MHLDGARIWHVAAETATPLQELCDPFDSVNLCFSKGLGGYGIKSSSWDRPDSLFPRCTGGILFERHE
jgi:hypothetical protein